MMRSCVFTLSVAFSVALSVAVRAAPADQKTEDARRELTARYAAISKAFEHKDDAAMNEPLLPGYTLKQPDGRVLPREAIVGGMKQQMQQTQKATWKRKIEDLSLSAGTAVATVSGVVDSTITVEGAAHKFHMTARTRDTWVKQAQKWMLKGSEVLENHVEIDGKPVGPPKRGA